MTKYGLIGLVILLIGSLFLLPARTKLRRFKNGKFSFTAEISGENITTTLLGNDLLNWIILSGGKVDTSSVGDLK